MAPLIRENGATVVKMVGASSRAATVQSMRVSGSKANITVEANFRHQMEKSSLGLSRMANF